MGVDLNKFRAKKFTRPTACVEVPELAELMFSNGDAPQLRVRGLTTNQLFLAKETMAKNSPLQILARAAASKNESDLSAAFRRVLGSEKDATAGEMAYRIELIVAGVIGDDGRPLFDYPDAVKLGEHFPSVFLRLSEKINELSGEGSQPGE